tara:strand:- start:3758 stop:4636 length:879 start_codon:yes stop_codon:yes gene_type:complete
MFKEYWQELENKSKPPVRINKLIELDYKLLKKNIDNNNFEFIKKIIKSLYSGDVYIVKKTFSKKFLHDIKKNCHKHFENKPSEFYKMLEGSPDFKRIIDIETGKKYSFRVCKNAYYFYNWNNDPIKIFPEIYRRWRVVKKLMGLNENEYEKNTPKDGVVDRIQIVKYPSKYGFLEPHSDPYKFQRLFISGYMSKKGKDFLGGGFYVLSKKNKILDVEKKIDIGDMGLGYATIIHGVAPVNRKIEPDLNDPKDGRWFLSMYSNQSDEVKIRHTGYSVTKKLNLKNHLLFPPNN